MLRRRCGYSTASFHGSLTLFRFHTVRYETRRGAVPGGAMVIMP